MISPIRNPPKSIHSLEHFAKWTLDQYFTFAVIPKIDLDWWSAHAIIFIGLHWEYFLRIVQVIVDVEFSSFILFFFHAAIDEFVFHNQKPFALLQNWYSPKLTSGRCLVDNCKSWTWMMINSINIMWCDFNIAKL